MATKKQIAANRQNATKSTGPRTAAGKKASSVNAVTHGLFSNSSLTMFETGTALYQLLAKLLHEYDPEGAYERSLVWRLTQLLMKERRLVWYESVQREIDQGQALRAAISGTTGKEPEFEDLTAFDKATAPLLMPMASIDEMLKCGRYQTMLQNQIERTVRELERVQAKRVRASEITDASDGG